MAPAASQQDSTPTDPRDPAAKAAAKRARDGGFRNPGVRGQAPDEESDDDRGRCRGQLQHSALESPHQALLLPHLYGLARTPANHAWNHLKPSKCVVFVPFVPFVPFVASLYHSPRCRSKHRLLASPRRPHHGRHPTAFPAPNSLSPGPTRPRPRTAPDRAPLGPPPGPRTAPNRPPHRLARDATTPTHAHHHHHPATPTNKTQPEAEVPEVLRS